MNLIGETIKRYRMLNKISSKDLSKLIGKAPAYISQIENGRNNNPNVEVLKLIFHELNVPQYQTDKLLSLSLQNNDITHSITTNFIDKNTLEMVNDKIKKDAKLIAEELMDLNDETKKILIKLLENQIN